MRKKVQEHAEKHTLLWRSLLIVILASWSVAFLSVVLPDKRGVDFLPFWVAGKMLTQSENPYLTSMTDYVANDPVLRQFVPLDDEYVKVGFVYPLPLLLILLPLTLLPLHAASLLYLAISLGMIGGTLWLGRNPWRVQLCIVLLFMPLFMAVVYHQPTLLLVGIAALLFLALNRRWYFVAGFALAILPLKPQAGMIFAISGVVYALLHMRRALLWAAIWFTVLWCVSAVAMPDWIRGFLSVVRPYFQYNEVYSLLPWGLILVVLAFRLSWYAGAAALQIVLFPINNVYGVLPLIFVWLEIRSPVALIGSGISWLWIIASLPKEAPWLWPFIMLPAILGAGYEVYARHVETQATSIKTPTTEQ